MATTAAAPQARAAPLAESLGRTWSLAAPVQSVVFDRRATVAAFMLGSGGLAVARCDGDDDPIGRVKKGPGGSIEITPSGRPPSPLAQVFAAPRPGLTLAADVKSGFLCGQQDGSLFHVEPDGNLVELAGFAEGPLLCIAASQHAGLRACAVGNEIHLFRVGIDRPIASLRHAQAVTALAFDHKGRRIAAGHDGGVLLWRCDRPDSDPKILAGPGPQTDLVWSPDDRFIAALVTQGALQIWRLRDAVNVVIDDFASAPSALAWMKGSGFLIADGNTGVVCWPVAGMDLLDLPFQAERLGIPSDILVTGVACHPRHGTIAAGYENGAVLLCRRGQPDVVFVKAPGGGAVRVLAWSGDGRYLAFGTDEGEATLVSFPPGLFK